MTPGSEHGAYSPFVDAIVRDDDLLTVLRPSSVRKPELLPEIRAADGELLAGGRPVRDASMLELVRAGLFYALDALDESHPIVQKMPDDISAYWHGMIHRREGDFENARYWFRRAGRQPAFPELQERAARLSADFARQLDWDPYLFTSLCERATFGEESAGLVALRGAEFEVMFDYAWRQAV